MVIFNLFVPFIISAALGTLVPDAISDQTVSGSDYDLSEDIEIENKIDSSVEASPEEKIVLRGSFLFSTYSYSNDSYVGYNYYTFSVSNGDTFTFLCDGFYYSSCSWNDGGGAWKFIFSGDGSSRGIVYLDKNGIISSHTLNSVGQVLAKSSNFNYTDSSLTFTLIDSGVVSSGGGDDPLPEDPDTPIVSGGDYAEILQSIDDRLNYFEDLFYYGSSIDDMGNGFKLIIVLIFLVTINIVLKLINWR